MNKKKVMVIILIIGIILIGVAVYLYYQQGTDDSKRKQTVSKSTTELDVTTEVRGATTKEAANITQKDSVREKPEQGTFTTTEQKQNKELPDNYEWDEKQWGEPPQIVYDFAENKEKFDFIVSEVDSILSGEDGFSTWIENGKIHYDDKYGNQLSSELKKEIDYLFNNTNFYEITKYEFGHWDMEYKQYDYRERYMYTMIYDPKLTEEEIWGVGYIKVVEDWYFLVTPLA
ncbi:MAG: hypothetical protein J6D02_08995 [Lachnospira sp.]|nr:hypothetical protein [Lachnospira sp.]